MQLIGINVFSDSKRLEKRAGSQILFETMDTKSKLALGKRVKKEAIEFAESQGIKIGKKNTYAVKQTGRDEFWANPKTDLLNVDWFVILNNNEKLELTVLNIPAKSLQLKSESNDGLHVRTDKKELINLNINTETLIDRLSGIDFSKYLVKKIEY